MSDQENLGASGPYVAFLTDTAATDPALVGGKGVNLARLTAAGLPVPEGFCVTTLAYDRLTDDESIQERIRALSKIDPSDTAAIADAGAVLRARIENLDVPEEVQDAIETALRGLVRGSEEALAVRSSATAEDLPNASFAGQQGTFLNVRETEEVVDRVRACMGESVHRSRDRLSRQKRHPTRGRRARRRRPADARPRRLRRSLHRRLDVGKPSDHRYRGRTRPR